MRRPAKLLALLALLAACKKDKPTAAPAPAPDARATARTTPPADAAPVAVAHDAAPADAAPLALADGEVLTVETLTRLLRAVDGCRWDSTGAGLTSCPAADLVTGARQLGSGHMPPDLDAEHALVRAAASALLAEPSPQVRYFAVRQLYFQNDLAAILDVVAGERDPEARWAMATLVAGSASSDPALAKVVLGLADDPDPRIRREIAWGLRHARGVPGALDKLVAMVGGDADVEARAHACDAIGEHGDPASLAFYRSVLVVGTDPQVYDACLQGLLELWIDPDNANRDAYRLSLELIGKGPYRPVAPSVELSNPLRGLPAAIKEDRAAWAGKPWVKVPELRAALLALARAKDADAYLREAVVELLPEYGARKKDLVAIRKALPDPPGEDLASLAAKLDETIAATPR